MSLKQWWPLVPVALGAALGSCKRATSEPPLPPGTHVGFYAAPGGVLSAVGDGNDPWDLATALHGGKGLIQPGDTVWLRGGTYVGPFSSTLTGTSTASIIVRGYPGERAVIDGKNATGQIEILSVDGAYTVFRDFEILNSLTDRTIGRHSGVYLRDGTNIKLVNLIIHDTGMGIFAEPGTKGCEIYGNIIYNEGWETPTRSNGHAFYLKQDATGSKLIKHNIAFNSFGLGIHAYTDAGAGSLHNMTFDGNVIFNSGTLSTFPSANVLIGGEEVADGIVVRQNRTYFSPSYTGGSNLRIGYLNLVNGAVKVDTNVIVGGAPELDTGFWTSIDVVGNTISGPALALRVRQSTALTGYTWSGNQYYRDPTANAWSYNGTSYNFAGWQGATGLGASDQATATPPAQPVVTVLPNAYEAGRATIVVYNWSSQTSAAANLSSVLSAGDSYAVYSVFNLFGPPLLTGTYSGSPLNIPLGTVSPPAPIGGSPAGPLDPGAAFGVFIVRRAS